MRTVYAVRVSGPRAALRRKAQQVVETWVEAQFPSDEISAGTKVRRDDLPDWFRVVIDQHVDDQITSQLVVALRSDAKGLAFEARQVEVPRKVRVLRRSVARTNVALLRLVREIVDLIGAVDAGVAVSSRARIVSDAVDAAGVAALCEAPSRSLPVVVETARVNGERVFHAENAPGALAGLAHVVVLADDVARRAFNEAWGADLLGPSAVTVCWPDREIERFDGAGLTDRGGRSQLVRVIEHVIEAGASSLPQLPRGRPQRPAIAALGAPSAARRVPAATRNDQLSSGPDTGAIPSPATSGGGVFDEESDVETVTMGELLGVLDELEQAWNRVDDLQSAVAAADAMVSQTNARADLLESRIDDLVRAKVDLEIRLGRKPETLSADSPPDALARARMICRHLVFAGDYRDIADLSGVDPTLLLVDLVKLDSVAVQWTTGDITDTTVALACRNVGLDFASDISESARNQYAEDYAIEWQDETVLATAHVRRGKGSSLYRIHVYLDRERRRVVVGHIGRHLRGKRD